MRWKIRWKATSRTDPLAVQKKALGATPGAFFVENSGNSPAVVAASQIHRKHFFAKMKFYSP
jgi:hypothetical protein